MQFHDPVMLGEVLAHLAPGPGKVLVDGTLGSAGHAVALLGELKGQGVFVGLDRDPAMVRRARERLSALPEVGQVRVIVEATRYEGILEVLKRENIAGADGVLLDLGYNSLQVDDAARGFSFLHDGVLDARYDANEPGTRSVAEIVNTAPAEELIRILREFADERHAPAIARRIVAERADRPFETTRQLADCIERAYPARERHGRIHPATRAFQALRIAANDELGCVERGVRACMEALAPGGTLVVLSYHSGEERIVKRLFDEAGSPRPDPSNPYSATTTRGLRYRVASRSAAMPTDEEIARNPRARSARLRAIRRVEQEAA